jgi:hypothetical protein
MGDEKEQLVKNKGKLVEHELYPTHNELSLVEHEWYPTHYDMEKNLSKRDKYVKDP